MKYKSKIYYTFLGLINKKTNEKNNKKKTKLLEKDIIILIMLTNFN